jgi:GTPase SAR1 family protein
VIDGHHIDLALWDTDAQEDRLRPLSYAESNVILISFAVDSPDSLYNVKNKVCDYSLFVLAMREHAFFTVLLGSAVDRRGFALLPGTAYYPRRVQEGSQEYQSATSYS